MFGLSFELEFVLNNLRPGHTKPIWEASLAPLLTVTAF